MRTSLSIAALLLTAIGSIGTVQAQAGGGPEDCVAVKRVREFAVETSSTVIVRTPMTNFRRITVPAGCADLNTSRLVFEVGTQSFAVSGASGGVALASEPSIINRVCTQTPHARVVFVDSQRQVASRCEILSIETVTAADFEAAGEATIQR